MKNKSRRTFLKTAAVSGAGLFIGRALPSWGRTTAKTSIVPPIAVFPYSNVQLLDGPMLTQFEQNHKIFLALDEDGMLKPFRQRQGLPAPGPDLGGWYDNADDFNEKDNFHGFIAGHTFGQYVSGLARAYAVTGSKPTQEKVHRLVRGFAETVEPTGKFYVDYRLPGYTFDKTCCGLIDAHEFAADPHALTVLKRSTDAVLPHLPEKALSRAEQEARPHKTIAYSWDETYTLPENFFLAYQRSGDARYRDLGKRFIYHEYYDALADNQNALPGKHAYSHVNTFSSAMQAYLTLGEEKYLRAATNGLRMVQEQSYATGGWGPDEAFVEPGKGLLAASLDKTRSSFETPCGAYGQFKITRYLLRVTGESRYGDSMEQIYYNTVAGAKPILADGTSFYYADYKNDGARKVYYKDKWPCCSGTFPQLTADYGISSYYSDRDGVYVNLFTPSRLHWTQNGARCSLTQHTAYPSANTTQLQFEMARPESFSLRLRIPAWTDSKTRISVNGKRVEGEIIPGKFFAITRTWKTGDRVEFEIAMPLRLQSVDPQNADTVALLRGPVALFAVGKLPAKFSRAQLLGAEAAAPSSADYFVKTDAGKVTFRPYTAIADEPYRLYQKV
ncbi:MAG TPA: beta-L-arabinofuranosidase domain-containing protein [Candidatus Saccharimonadales bacterium]|nr:beta-L-arabinofuranosidase domain-containing protein [Candidatus Saccharimonadales bacterium]